MKLREKKQQNQTTKKSQMCNMQWRLSSFCRRKTTPVVLRHFTREEFFAMWRLLGCSEAWSNTRGRWNWRMSYEEEPHHRKHSQVEDSCCYELLKTSAGCSFLSSFQKPEMAFSSIFLSLLAVLLPLKEGLYVKYLSSWHELNHKGSAACCSLFCSQLKIRWDWAS